MAVVNLESHRRKAAVSGRYGRVQVHMIFSFNEVQVVTSPVSLRKITRRRSTPGEPERMEPERMERGDRVLPKTATERKVDEIRKNPLLFFQISAGSES